MDDIEQSIERQEIIRDEKYSRYLSDNNLEHTYIHTTGDIYLSLNNIEIPYCFLVFYLHLALCLTELNIYCNKSIVVVLYLIFAKFFNIQFYDLFTISNFLLQSTKFTKGCQ